MVKMDDMVNYPIKVSEDELIRRIKHSITSTDLRNYFGNDIENKIVKYNELKNYRTILDLLPQNKSFKIILIENEYNKGHWVLVLRYGNTIEWFNSYGDKPEATKRVNGSLKNRLLGQTSDELKRLFKSAPSKFKVIYNKRKFQKLKPDINTCGRWVILRILTAMNMNMDLTEFNDMITKAQKATGLPLDGLVSLWVPDSLKDV